MNTQHLDTLRAERLHYTLRRSRDEGKNLFFQYSEQFENSDYLSRLLAVEMRPFIHNFQSEEQFQIYERMINIERRLGEYQQVATLWREIIKLGEKHQQSSWRLEALIGLHNITWRTNPQQSLQQYLMPALSLCQSDVSEQLARVEYEIGFAYRRLQQFDEAVEWYKKAMKNAREKPRMATILNDLGYVYTFQGEHDQAQTYVNAALTLRKEYWAEIRQKIHALEPKKLTPATTPADEQPRSESINLKIQESDAKLRVGMSHNTLGQILRFRGDLHEAIYHYSQALMLFEESEQYSWQVRALTSRGEAYRRLANEKSEQSDPKQREQHNLKAKNDFDRSLYLCDKYQVDEEKSTAYRRIGRWVHDQAIAEIRTGQKQAAITALTDAQKYLQEGLVVAKKTNNAFEEFQNLTELALLADDAVEATDGSSDIAQQDYLIYLNDLEQALQSPQAQTVPIHDLDVFKNLLQVEKGAYAFVQGRFDEALENYLQGYKGLASIPGYGSVRFRAMWGHLTGRIEKLTDDEMAKAWCEKFIKEWENSFIERGGTRLTLLQLYPEFVRWCELHPLLRNM